MKLQFRFVCNVVFLCCLVGGSANAQGCKYVDKGKLANVMGINKELVPFLNLEIPSCANIYLADGYVGFVLNEQNERLNNGIRSEISIDYPFAEGDTIEYRWSIMVPSKNEPGGETSQWWLIAQWHDQPNPKFGETWATFKSQPPPVAIYIENRGGSVGIGLQGIQGKKITWAPVPTDIWLNLSVKIHWSTLNNGSVNFSVDDHPELDAKFVGRNMLNSYQHYFKAGQYRAPRINKYSKIYIKNVRFRKL